MEWPKLKSEQTLPSQSISATSLGHVVRDFPCFQVVFPQHQTFSRLSQTFKFIQTAFGSVKLSIAAVPCSRPKPESRTPPQGNRTSV